MTRGKVKVGVFGARRGMSMVNIMSRHPEAELVAICDKYTPYEAECERIARESGLNIAYYSDFEAFFQHDMDAVVLANYANEHAPFAIRLLQSGRHVISEVMAVETLGQAVSLAEAVERSGKVYAYAANTCYYPTVLEMKRLYDQGELGDFVHGEGEYIHDCEAIWHRITYGERDHWRNRISYANFYCTHALGPILSITGARPVKVVGFETPNVPYLKNVGYAGGASGMILLQMDNGASVKVLNSKLKREPALHWFSISGTKGVAETDRWDDNRLSVYREGRETSGPMAYNPEFAFRTELSGSVTSHGGSDFYTLHYFLEKILGREGGKHSLDVYQALDMSVPGILAHRSICGGSVPLEMPDFRNREAREACRDDSWCTNPAVAGNGSELAPMSSFGDVEIPDSVYERVKEEWERSRK